MPGLNPLRHQLASTSPVSFSGLVAAATAGRTKSGAPDDPVARLRKMVCEEYAVADAVLCGSGTEAVVLALEAAERFRGEPTTVVLPSFSCFDVAAAAVRFGRPVLFYDVDPRTLGPDPESLRASLRGENRTVLIASLFGIPIDWDELDPMFAETGAFVVEDAAQGHGARWKGARLGGHGRLGVLSFGRGKGWTGGAGGALLVRDEADRDFGPDRAALARSAGTASIVTKATAHWALGRPGIYGVPRAVPALGLGETRYRDANEPRSMSQAAAVLALDSRGTAERWAQARVEAAARYAKQLSGVGLDPGIRVLEGSAGGYVRFPILLPGGLGSFSKPDMAVRLGAATSYPATLPVLSALRSLAGSFHATSWPGARSLVEQLITLPTHPLTRKAERDRLVELLGPQ